MKRVVVLGCGKVGSAIAIDLTLDFEVTVADRDRDGLRAFEQRTGIRTEAVDLLKEGSVASTVAPFDIVVNATPGFMGYSVLDKIISEGRNVADISFFPEDPFQLHDRALKNNIAAVVDCGVAPGLCNILLGHHLAEGEVLSYTCFVGGLPFKREKPFEYKAPFSPSDVIEEYVRPARMRIDGKEVTKEALSEIELLDFEKVGQLEAFNTDGLRTILRTTKVRNLTEKTLRYPGHASLMRSFRDTGLFDKEAIIINGIKVSPLEVTSGLLFRHWKAKEGEREFTIMKVIVEMKDCRHEYEVFDVTDEKSGISSMSRTTGYTCTAALRTLAGDLYRGKGIIAPEEIGKDAASFAFILSELKNRGINIEHRRINE